MLNNAKYFVRMIAFDIPTLTPAQCLANMGYELLKQTAAFHQSGQCITYHELDPEQVRSVHITGLATHLMEIDLPATKFFPAKCYLVATVYCRFDGMHLSEIKLFSKHYEKY